MRLVIFITLLASASASASVIDKRFWFNGGNAEQGGVLGLGVGIGSDPATPSSTTPVTLDSTSSSTTISSSSDTPTSTTTPVSQGPGPVRHHHSKKQFVEPVPFPAFNPFFSEPFGDSQIGTTQDTHLHKVKHGKKAGTAKRRLHS